MSLRDDADPLCCCEYRSDEGARSHLLALCCDCEDIDDTCDRWLKGVAVPDSNYTRIASVLSDRLRVPCPGGARRPPWTLLGVLLVWPLTAAFCAQGPVCLLLGLMVPPTLLRLTWIAARRLPDGQLADKVNARLEDSSGSNCRSRRGGDCGSVWPPGWMWHACTGGLALTLLLVFELVVVAGLTVSWLEHQILMSLLAVTVICWYSVRMNRSFVSVPLCTGRVGRSESPSAAGNCGAASGLELPHVWCPQCKVTRPPRTHHCRICRRCVLLRDHHCIWLDCCIGGDNQRAFMLGLLTSSVSLLYSAHLTLTSVCYSRLAWDAVLMPRNCTDAFSSLGSGMALYCAIVSLLVAALCLCLLLHQCHLVSLNVTGVERRRRIAAPPLPRSSVAAKWIRFLAGRRRPVEANGSSCL